MVFASRKPGTLEILNEILMSMISMGLVYCPDFWVTALGDPLGTAIQGFVLMFLDCKALWLANCLHCLPARYFFIILSAMASELPPKISQWANRQFLFVLGCDDHEHADPRRSGI